MPLQVFSGAQLVCSFGLGPGALTVFPRGHAVEGPARATVLDIVPNLNIAPFPQCTAPGNPLVAAATAAAMGAPTPAACTPLTVAPWQPGAAKTKVDALPALTSDSTCTCAFGGQLRIVSPGAKTEVIE